ncbi:MULTISPECIES: thiamine pyrophosphate-binding protein [Bradyrhizobium]|uniref:Benzoylformate decarboxylase n=2 Tax=Bradyrhizobium TaxID=374 RepID=A0ABY0PHN4_9BRAD|nr:MULTISPECIES: thiamine pyrophosphate-binding protein [Bradyrhizobium]SDI40008.1 benzoylformate decarboxylase [Bradyrhizobium ottawaense]SED56940.1 benzoylformate decarboxylase [Bradyrhizobium lablabi]SHL55674.1 benzoylformate decarboxylase [Bradyrhizobium lablabi]
MKNKITGRSAFLALLKDEGITHLFGNPGTTELPIMHALKDHPDLTYVMAMQESLVVAMADGFSRASGKLVACNVHVAPGLGNAMGSLFNASFTGTPMILTAGQQEQGHGLQEPVLYGPLVQMAEPLVKWAVEVTRLEDLPRIVRRAAKIAMTPPTGPVFISLPGDILNAEAGIELGRSTRIDTRVRPSDESLNAFAARILKAERPVIIVGDEVVKRDALKEAAEFAETLGCPAYQSSTPFGAHFLSESPCFMGALARIQKLARDALTPYDLIIAVGGDPLRMSVYSEVDPLPDGLSIVQVGLVDHDLAKNYSVDIALKADVKETLRALIPALKAAGGSALEKRAKQGLAELASKNWTAKRKMVVDHISKSATTTPIDPDWLALQVIESMPDNAILVDEGLTSSRQIIALRPHRDRYGYHALASGGIGWGLPASVGVSLANPDRPVVCYSGDGSSMYSIQSLWTAANQNLPLTFVIVNNGGYRIIKQRLLAFHGDDHYVGMDFKDPPVDFTALAKSMGLEATRVTDPTQLKSVLSSAFSRPGAKLIEVMVNNAVN